MYPAADVPAAALVSRIQASLSLGLGFRVWAMECRPLSADHEPQNRNITNHKSRVIACRNAKPANDKRQATSHKS